ncbi:MerR family transcriptional regulator [Cellulomonas sp. ATA003]|uniref:MerR family transcriptional regulator n=1 Tax=Cellulomonas sp. ATA003 TaxID=3073064 RepID=UPI00287383A0|nr:MerR family transcriptional regulator [Cellulomonas sp. ATA003]WNB86046.1 MerR family transcriptional regulator [Cellulomonas sp. ATA003]
MTSTRDRGDDVARPRPSRSDAPPEVPALTVAAVARRLGVAPATLRTWDRRYGLGPSEHSAGSHRRYTADDVARLLVMRRLTLEGVAPVEAARAARDADPALAGDSGARILPHTPTGDAPARAATPASLVEAALAQDEAECRAQLASAADDVAAWWTGLVEPARAGLASRTVLARPGEDPEAVLEASVLAVLRARPVPAEVLAAVGQRVVLLLAPPDHARPLALHALAAALTDRGVDARVLAGPVDRHRVLELAVMVRPVAVALVGEQPAPDLAIVGELHAAQPDLPLFVGLVDDEAAATLPLDHAVHRARSFTGLFHEVLAVSRP